MNFPIGGPVVVPGLHPDKRSLIVTVPRSAVPDVDAVDPAPPPFSKVETLPAEAENLSSMSRRKDPNAIEVMRSIKAALDPNNIMNPGKVIPARLI